MAVEYILCYGMLIIMGMMTVVRSVQVWQDKRDPEYQRIEKFCRDLNEIERLIKETKKYAKLTMKSLNKFIAQAEKDGLIKKEK